MGQTALITAIEAMGEPAFVFDRRGAIVGSNSPFRTMLTAAGARWQDVVKMNVYVRDLTSAKVKLFREIRQRHLLDHQPASTLVATPGLVHEDMMLEVEVVAQIA